MRTMRGIIKGVTRRKGRVGLVWSKSGVPFRGTSWAAGVDAGVHKNMINANRKTKTTRRRGGL